MNYKSSTLMILMAAAYSMQAMAQNNIQRDSVTNTKEEKNRNVMLNASSVDQPRQINVGLPTSRSPRIFEDGLPVSYMFYPDMPYYSWYGGATYDKTSVMSLSEGAIQYGDLTYIVDSRNKRSTKNVEGIVKYDINHFGRQILDAAITGPIGKGWGYSVNTHQMWDPGTYKISAAALQNRTQSYKFALDKTFAQGRGRMDFIYQYSSYRNNSANYGPFIFNGDGSVSKYKGFNLGTDSYLNADMNRFTYMDIVTGELKTIDWKDAGTVKNHTARFNLEYNFKNGNKFELNSKVKTSRDNSATISMTGITPNNGNYYYSTGEAYTGDYVQNLNLAYLHAKTTEWNTTAKLTGISNNGHHSWRLGASYWGRTLDVPQSVVYFVQEVQENPQSLYGKDSNGNLQRSTTYNTNAAYAEGHETDISMFASDDWNISRKLFMSLGVRLAYQGYAGYSANNVGGVTTNSRSNGWYLNNGTAQRTRIAQDFINPSAAYNIRYTIAPGFGLSGEYVFTTQHVDIKDYGNVSYPNTDPSYTHMGSAGIFWNNRWFQLVSKFTYLKRTNQVRNANISHVLTSDAIDGSGLTKGSEQTVSDSYAYDIQTIGWTTDVVVTPVKWFAFHGSVTVQDPQYKKFTPSATFSDGQTITVDLDGNNVTALSKLLIELDPSVSFGKWKAGLNFRYFGKQYINKTNTLYFNGWWETFANVKYALNKKIDLGLNIVNLFNVTGATGEIQAADLVTDTSGYTNYLMTGAYLRPFEIGASVTIKF